MSTHPQQETRAFTGAGSPASQQRSWWDVHQFIEAVVRQADCGPIPAAGTPAWTALADGDPRKLLAVAIDGEHWTLRIETNQIALAEASRAVAASPETAPEYVPSWSSLAQSIRRRDSSIYIPRKAS